MTTIDEWLSAAGNNDPDWPRHPDFVAADLDRAVAALRAVVDLHTECRRGGDCEECRYDYPCPTVKAIDRWLTREATS